MMKAIIINTPGPPENLHLTTLPIPIPAPNHIRIRVHAFGLNRSEMFTRQGHSPVTFPRILGIEAVGVVDAVAAPATEALFPQGSIVATAMGGMGRAFDGGYAEYVCVPARQVQVLSRPGRERERGRGRGISWAVLGALPEMMQTAWGAVIRGLELKAGESLLVRGGTTSVGLAAVAIALKHGASVAASTRRKDRAEWLREDVGVHEVWVDDGNIAGQMWREGREGYDKVLELVGTATLKDSLRCVRKGGTVCLAGIAGGEWVMEGVNPMELIPSETRLTVYSGSEEDFMRTPLEVLVRMVEGGRLKVQTGPVFRMDEIVEAHRCMEENEALGKIVVLV